MFPYFFFIFLWIFIKGKTIDICFKPSNSGYSCSGTIFSDINETTNFSDIILNQIDANVDKIAIYLIGPFQYQIALRILNKKTAYLYFYNSASGNLDLTGSSDINLQLNGKNQNKNNVYFISSDNNYNNVSVSLENINMSTELLEMKIQSFKIIDSEINCSKYLINSFNYYISKNEELMLYDNYMVFDNKNFSFFGANQKITLYTYYNKIELIVNNQASQYSSISSFYFNGFNTVLFKGNNFINSNYFSIYNCREMKISSSLDINADFSFSKSYEYNFNIKIDGNDTNSRIPININSISIIQGMIEIFSSYLDITVKKFVFNTTSIPIIPCIGSGGCSTFTANIVTHKTNCIYYSFDTLYAQLDIEGKQTDDSLSTLMSKDWNIITFKSFAKGIMGIDIINVIDYKKYYIYGFMEEGNIITVEPIIIDDDYTVKLHANSYTTIPLYVCHEQTSCKNDGISIKNISDLENVIPPAQKQINLYLSKSTSIDLSSIKTTKSTLTIYASDNYVESLITSEYSENANIDHLIFYEIRFGGNNITINTNKVTFYDENYFSEKVHINPKSSVYFSKDSYIRGNYENLIPSATFFGFVAGSQSLQESDAINISDRDIRVFHERGDYQNKLIDKRIAKSYTFILEIKKDIVMDVIFSTKEIENIELKFIPVESNENQSNYQIHVRLLSLKNLIKANKIHIDFGNFTNNIINLNNFQKKSYISTTGENIKFINQAIDSENDFCLCKDSSCDKCPSNLVKLGYDEISEKIHYESNEPVQVTVFNTNDGDSPIINLTLFDNKFSQIIGGESNTKVLIDCSTKIESSFYRITFSNIILAPYSSGTLYIYKLNLPDNCIIDKSFNEIDILLYDLSCKIDHLVFKTVHIKQSLIVDEYNEINHDLTSKVTFDPKSNLELHVPEIMTFKGIILKIKNIEFDLTKVNVKLILQLDYKSENLYIIGDQGNLDETKSDISFEIKNIHVHFNGTWANENPSKFLRFRCTDVCFHIQSMNIPANIILFNNCQFILEKEKVGICGELICGNGRSNISSTINEPTIFNVTKISFDPYGVDIKEYYYLDFLSPKIIMEINQSDMDYNAYIQFNLLVGLDGANMIKNWHIKESYSLKIYVKCTVTGNINDSKVLEFIDKKFTIYETKGIASINPYFTIDFEYNHPFGFTNDNFDLIYNDTKIVFCAIRSILHDPILLRYGECNNKYGCPGTIIADDNLSNIEEFIPFENANVSITFYSNITNDNILDFNKVGLSIYSLVLKGKSNNYITTKFGSSISCLNAENLLLNISDNENFILQNLTLTNCELIQQLYYTNVNNYLSVDDYSLCHMFIEEYPNDFEIHCSKYVSINYTCYGILIHRSYYSQYFNVNVTKFKNVILNIKSGNTFHLDDNVTEIKHIKNIIFNTDEINIGRNWEKSDRLSKISFEMNCSLRISVNTYSMPLNAWDSLYNYNIYLPKDFGTYVNDTVVLNNHNLAIITENEITFKEFIFSGNSSIYLYYNSRMFIESVTVKRGGITKLKQVEINNDITMEPGSQLLEGFDTANLIKKINIQWDLNEVPIINPNRYYLHYCSEINIIYIGQPIQGRENDFDLFFFSNNGVKIFGCLSSYEKFKENIHFISNTEELFNDGEKLMLKYFDKYTNEIWLTLKKRLSKDPLTKTINPTTEPSEIATEPSEITTKPSEIPTEPIINDNYESTSSTIEFVKDGYKDGDKIIETNNNDDISIIKSTNSNIVLKTGNDSKKDLFVSPQTQNSIINIAPPSEEQSNYGNGEFGIHANSNNPQVILPQSKVPLNIFNNENSELTFNFIDSKKSDSISLEKLTVNKGTLQINIPVETKEIEFNEIESFSTGKIIMNDSSNGQEIGIGTLKLNRNSVFYLPNTYFKDQIHMGESSEIIINTKVKFNESSIINFIGSSIIELQESSIDGICKEINYASTAAQQLEKVVNSKLICGVNFKCLEWKDKFKTNDNFLKYSNCVKYDNEMCLVATNRDINNNGNNNNKKPLSKGAIAAIVIVVVLVVVAVIIATVIILKKKSNRKQMSEGEFNENNQNPNGNEVDL